MIHVGIRNDLVACDDPIEMGCDGFHHVSHIQLVLVFGITALHAPLFLHPQLQRSYPRIDAKEGRSVTATNGVLDVAFRPMITAFQPAVAGHTFAITKKNRCCHQ